MSLFNKEDITVHINNIEVGFVWQKEEHSYKYLRKIVFARNTGCLAYNNKHMLDKDDLMHAHVERLFKDGIDLCEKIDGESIIYPVKKNGDDYEIGDIIIFPIAEVGPLLRFLGFPIYLSRKEFKMLKKCLLDNDAPVKRVDSAVDLGDSENDSDIDRIDFVELKNSIPEFGKFKSSGNSIDVTEAEKAFFKGKTKTKDGK